MASPTSPRCLASTCRAPVLPLPDKMLPSLVIYSMCVTSNICAVCRADEKQPVAAAAEPVDAQGMSDDATPEAEDGQAAPAPAIPAEISEQVVLPRLADRSAVMAPADAIGELKSLGSAHSICLSACL